MEEKNALELDRQLEKEEVRMKDEMKYGKKE